MERRSGDRTLRWGYDADGLPAGHTHPDGSTLVRDRDRAGRTVALTHPLLGRVECDRDPVRRLTDLRASGIRRTWVHRDGLVHAYQVGTG